MKSESRFNWRPEAKIPEDEVLRRILTNEFDETMPDAEKDRQARLLSAGILPEDLAPPTQPREIGQAEARRIVALGHGIEEADLPPLSIGKFFWLSLMAMVAGWSKKHRVNQS